ncbi:MAG: dTDP-4-dehydrorhamnose reductase [bacterium]|nr:dTDP-4-dehydrorhamnose reductase [bacterium]
MLVAVTGAAGMLGKDIMQALADAGHRCIGADIGDFDITSYSATAAWLKEHSPDIVIHGAAMTDVDGCEAQPERAYIVNAVGSWNVAAACRETGASIIAVSTDYVFDGAKTEPYMEYDRVCPINAYGSSKAAAEAMVAGSGADYKIVRTSWLYGPHGRNFVYAILDKAKSGVEYMNVVADQRGAPTFTGDLAVKLTELLVLPHNGIFHVTGGEVCSWYDFAGAILAAAGYDTELHPISTAELNRPAGRPANSALSNLMLESLGLKRIGSFRDTLDDMIRAHKDNSSSIK